MADPTKSDSATPAPSGAIEIEDSRGRKLILKRPNVLAQYRLVRTLGAEAAANPTYVGMLMPLLFLQQLDGNPVSLASQREIDLAIQQLDEDGLMALTEGVAEHFTPKDDEDALKKP
jgi:hypothetical protein